MAITKGFQISEPNPLKRYLVFFGQYYYPQGGINDMESDFRTLEAAQKRAKELFDAEKLPGCDKEDYDLDALFWCYIYDTHTRTKTEIIWHLS